MTTNRHPGFNTYRRRYHTWPAHEIYLYDLVGQKNQARENALTEEQAERYGRMRDYWLERCAHYDATTNYADDLCEVLACQDVLNVVTRAEGGER